MRSLRILHCRQGDRVWGPERQILQLAQHLPNRGIDIEIVLLRRWGLDAEPHPLAVQAQDLGCTVHEIPARPQDLPHVIRLLQSRLADCDLLHTHEFKSDLLGWTAARLSGRPWVATDHHLATDDEPLLRLFGIADHWALKHADIVLVPSHSQAQRLARHVAKQRIRVIHHGIDAAAFARSAGGDRMVMRQRYGVDPTQPLISVFGRLEPVKGHSDFLRAAQIMLQQRPDLRFWIVGDGRLERQLQGQARALAIADKVQFLGYQREVAPLMAASDVIMLPSRHESFGIVLIEAMSLGKPIVASASGGIPEVVLDGIQGYLVAPGNAAELSERVLQLVANPAHALQLGRAGRERVNETFDVQLMVERMALLYRQMVSRGGAIVHEPGVEPARLYPLSNP